MALNKLIINFGLIFGLGYGALKYYEMKQENLEKEIASSIGPVSEAEKKRRQFMDVLKAAADNKLHIKELSGKQDGTK